MARSMAGRSALETRLPALALGLVAASVAAPASAAPNRSAATRPRS